ncbi:MAG: ATP-dependent zinc metalloprotease FtsH [Lawsonibacter sp.]
MAWTTPRNTATCPTSASSSPGSTAAEPATSSRRKGSFIHETYHAPGHRPVSHPLRRGLYSVSYLQRADWEDGPDYSQIRTYFTQERVEYFTLKDNVLTLTLRDEGGSDKTSTFTYELARTDFFYNDMHQLIDQQLADGILKGYDYPPGIENAWWYSLIGPVLMVAAAGVFLFVIFRQRAAASGGPPGANRFGHARTRTLSDQSKPVTFNDVAGAEEEKGELQEIVEFLRDPERFTALGARIPKGVLLVGPPGTGKTLIAKAVAGEAGVHFLSISGSDFVELYVGVGASRVRDLFEQAKKEAPAIVFIDEIDAVGRRRGAGLGGGHDEREQTLNQLLVEMDGFGSNEGVIVLAATNRQDILDPALLRPGRFDRQIYVGLPDIRGREAILKVHAKRKPLAEDVSLAQIAQATAGFTGADLANLLNEAALLAARQHSQFITAAHLHEAMLKVIAGPEKKSRVVTDHARRLTAYHEAGHAVVIHQLPTQDPVHQITIVPRGPAGGMTISLPTEDKAYLSKKELEERIAVCLGGRVAKELVLQDVSTGASSDIQKASEIARAMVTKYGMSEKLGAIAYGSESDEIFLGRSMAQARTYSEEVAAQIDQEVKDIVDRAHARCRDILTQHRHQLDITARYLLDHETMDAQTFDHVFTQPDDPELAGYQE